MTLELGGRILLQFPVRYAAYTANALKPFISEPSDGAAIPGIVYDEGFIAVGRDFGLISHRANGFDAVQYAFPGRPQLYFINQAEKLDPFAIKSFARCFLFFSSCHDPKFRYFITYRNTLLLLFADIGSHME